MSRGWLWLTPLFIIVTTVVFAGDYAVRREIAGSYAEFTERFVKLGDYREVTLLLNRRFKQNFSAVALTSGSTEIVRLPPEHEYKGGFEASFQLAIPDTDKSLVFWYSCRTALLWALVANAFLVLVMAMTRRQQARRLKIAGFMERKIEMANLLESVSHDIRSPLSALNIAVSTLKGIDDDRKAIVTTATRRVNAIADSLLTRVKRSDSAFSEIDLSETIASLVAEKKVELSFDSLKFLEEVPGPFLVSIDGVNLSRMISNLINNSVQAGAKSVEVRISRRGERTMIQIKDDGPGIPKAILKRIGSEPITSGKPGNDGFGLGLWSAHLFAATNRGKLKIESSGHGTVITLAF